MGRVKAGGQETGRGSKSGGNRERQRKVQRKSAIGRYPSIGQRPLSPHLLPTPTSPCSSSWMLFYSKQPQELQYKQKPWLALKKDFQGTRAIRVFVVGGERVQKCVSRSRWL